MSLNVHQFRDLVIRPVVNDFKFGASEAVVELLLGTAIQESRLSHLAQLGGGPALGLYQVEPTTVFDLLHRYLPTRDDVRDRFNQASGFIPSKDWRGVDDDLVKRYLVTNLAFATAVARLKYWIIKEAVPTKLEDQAQYWKTHYNTYKGKGTTYEYIRNYRMLV